MQSRSDVDRVAGRICWGVTSSGNDLAGIHADTNPEPHAPIALELVVQSLEAISHVHGGSHCSEGVVLVHRRNAEHRHHCVADELLDHAPVPFQN